MQLRETDQRIIEGLAIPWNTPVHVPAIGVREQFAPGSVNPADLIGLPFLYRHGEPAGVIREAWATPEGVMVAARVAPIAAGDDLLALARERAIPGLSVGFDPIEQVWDAALQLLTRTRARITEVSAAVFPVYPSAEITAVREHQPPTQEGSPSMTGTPEAVAPAPVAAPAADPQTREAVPAPELQREVQALRATVATLSDVVDAQRASTQTREGLPWANEAEFWQAYVSEGLSRDTQTRERFAQQVRALEAVTSANAQGFTDRTTWGDDLFQLVNRNRRTAVACGIQPLAEQGLTVDYIEQTQGVITGDQPTELAPIASQAYESEVKQAPVFTEAGGNNVSLQLLLRSSPDFRTELMRDYARAYAQRWNARVIAELTRTTQVATLNRANLSTAAVAEFLGTAASLIATGADGDLDAVVLAPDLFFAVIAVSGSGFPLSGGDNIGNGSLNAVSVSAFGTTFIRDNGLAAGSGFAIHRASIGVKESPGAPMTISADNPGNLSSDIAVYGFGAVYARNLGGIVRLASSAPTTAAKAGK